MMVKGRHSLYLVCHINWKLSEGNSMMGFLFIIAKQLHDFVENRLMGRSKR